MKFVKVRHLYRGCHFKRGLPVLRALSSIQKNELLSIAKICYRGIYNHDPEFENIEKLSNDVGGGLKATEDGGTWNYGLTVDKDSVNFSVNGDFMHVKQFECFAYLLSKHFDLFGLIDSGQAIEA